MGRIPLYLLDTALPENDPAAQRITNELYGGGPEERLAQELVLGIGGIRALRALGGRPQVCHLNEGHAVFASLERMRDLMETAGAHPSSRPGRPPARARSSPRTRRSRPASTCSPKSLISHDLGSYPQGARAHRGAVHAHGPGQSATIQHEDFNVAVLALRQSPRRNAVSRLHRRVTARMMQPGWLDFPLSEMPVESVTNGVHTKTWVAAEMEQLFDHYLGPRWREDTSEPRGLAAGGPHPRPGAVAHPRAAARAAGGLRPGGGGSAAPRAGAPGAG